LLPRIAGRTGNILISFLSGLQSYSNGLRSVLYFVGSVLNGYRVWSL
jgi:hypothetical protein